MSFKEERAELLTDAMDGIDEDMIAQVDKLREQKPKPRVTPIRWSQVSAIAAGAAVLIMAGYMWQYHIEPEHFGPNMNSSGENGTQREDSPENWDAKPTEEATPEHYAPWGDTMGLWNSYSQVYVMNHEEWGLCDKNHPLHRAGEIPSAEYEVVDEFLQGLIHSGTLRKSTESMEQTDMLHLFFVKTDGNTVHVCLTPSGYGYYYDLNLEKVADMRNEFYVQKLYKIYESLQE